MKKFLYFIFLSVFAIPEFYSQTQTVTLTTGSAAGTGSWTVPCGITTITVQLWGGGGGGANSTTSQAGGGGGSGGYTQVILSTSMNTVFNYTVGAGGNGGGTGLSGSNGGTTTFSTSTAGGGTGGAVTGTGGGAGGAGGTTNGNAGANPSGTTGGNGGSSPNGGAGGAGGANGANGSNATVPGGGGGAAGQRSGGAEVSGDGANGRVIIMYLYPVINAVASSTLGSCATTTAALTATAITTPGWTGSWQCVGCTGITIANTTSATTTASGLAPGSVNYFQWVATYTATGCSVYDDLTITVPSCPITNNPCASAVTLTVDAGLMCGQVTTGASTEAGECYFDLAPPNAGLSRQSLWYRVTATNDSLVLNVAGYGSFGPPSILVYGPFAPGGGCVPGCASATITGGAVQGLSQDPGVHALLTGLATSGNHDYLIQVMGFGNLNWDFCINVANPASNSTAPANALIISNCGATFNGSTNGGYFGSGSGARKANLDNNLATFVAPYTNTTGNDVTFVVNNLSWFKFCSVNAGTYNVQFDVLSCVFPTGSNGSQMAILTGSNNSMTNIWEATNPTTPGTAVQTSPNFALAAGGCAYLVVDGYGGDACSYSYLLTNVSGGCVLLPIELLSFNAIAKEEYVELTWATATENNNDYFSVERSDDGINFKLIETVDGAGTTADVMFYSTKDERPVPGVSYYRLKQTDYDGKHSYSKIVSVEFNNKKDLKFEIVPNPTLENQATNIQLNFIPDGEVSISICDLNGVSVYESKAKHESSDIKISNEFAKGVYLVKIVTKDLVQTKRMLIR